MKKKKKKKKKTKNPTDDDDGRRIPPPPISAPPRASVAAIDERVEAIYIQLTGAPLPLAEEKQLVAELKELRRMRDDVRWELSAG